MDGAEPIWVGSRLGQSIKGWLIARQWLDGKDNGGTAGPELGQPTTSQPRAHHTAPRAAVSGVAGRRLQGLLFSWWGRGAEGQRGKFPSLPLRSCLGPARPMTPAPTHPAGTVHFDLAEPSDPKSRPGIGLLRQWKGRRSLSWRQRGQLLKPARPPRYPQRPSGAGLHRRQVVA